MSNHKYIFYLYPTENKTGTFIFSEKSKPIKTLAKIQNRKFDFKKIY